MIAVWKEIMTLAGPKLRERLERARRWWTKNAINGDGM